jgi:hypothetical protein
MAIYYIKTNGNDANTGLSPSQAWQTIQKGLGGSGITGGDTLYIAPGDYRNTASTVTMAGVYTTTTTIIGDVTASQFSGNTAGRVLITNRGTSDFSSSFFAGTCFSTGGKSNIVFQTLMFENGNTNSTICNIADSSNLTFDRCIFYGSSSQQNTALSATGLSAVYTRNHLFTRCIFYGNSNNYSEGNHTSAVGVTYDYNLTLDRCLNFGVSFSGSLITSAGRGFYLVNCTNCSMSLSNTKGFIVAKNCNYLWSGPSGGIFLLQQGSGSSATGNTVERCAYTTTNTYTHTAINNILLPGPIQSMSENRLWGLNPNYERSGFGESLNNQGTLYGTVAIPTLVGRAGYSTMGVPLTDLYGNPWDGNGNPHIGAYNDYSLSSISRYIPTDRTRTFLQFESGSTSNSIELYLGATGITAASVGLSAYYSRTRSSPVQINLVDTTVTSAWISGGIAEVSSSLMPGVYRLDVPNAAFVSGAEDVTILVRGLSGSNGAYVNCQLTNLSNSSIASTVWSYATRTLSATGLSAYDVWNFNNRTLSATGLSAYDVWNYTDRIITGGTGVSITQSFPDNFEFMLITNTGRIYLNKADIEKIRA